MIRAFFFFNDTATTEIYPLSLHDALPIWSAVSLETERVAAGDDAVRRDVGVADALAVDRERPPRTRHDVQKARRLRQQGHKDDGRDSRQQLDREADGQVSGSGNDHRVTARRKAPRLPAPEELIRADAGSDGDVRGRQPNG